MDFNLLEEIKEGYVGREAGADATETATLNEARVAAEAAARGHVYPQRNVYVVVEGCLALRAWRDLKCVLSDEANAALRDKYGMVKMGLAQSISGEYVVGMEYSMAKDQIIAEVLRVAGWTEDEIKEKEGLVTRWWEEDGWAEYVPLTNC